MYIYRKIFVDNKLIHGKKFGKIKRDEKLRIQGLKNEIVPQIVVGKSRMIFHRMRTTI